MQRLNAGKSWHKRKKPVQGKWVTGLIAVLFIGSGTALGNISQHYGELKDEELKAAALAAIQEASAQAEAAAHKIKEETAKAEEPTKAAPTVPETKEETESLPKPYEPAPDKLNLAYFYPEDAESEEIIDSYAGEVFQELMVLDLDWLSDLYELSDVSPSTMASRLGKGTKAVMGGYNPRDKAHRANNPSSWVIHDWKKIHVNFINGDGKAIDGFSNVKDILSMASVYTYFSDMMDVDTFSEYSRQLWKNSHSYSLSMGDLYYCSGCLNKTEEELVREAEEEEFAAEAMSFGMNGQAGRTGGQNSLPSGEIWEGGVSGVQGSAARGLTESSAAGTTAAQAESVPAETAAAQASSMPQAESMPAETTAAQVSSMAQAESMPAETTAAQASSMAQAESVPAETTAAQVSSIEQAESVSAESSVSGSSVSGNSAFGNLSGGMPTDSSVSGNSASGNIFGNASPSDLQNPTGMGAEAANTAAGSANQKTGKKTQYDCPGHVDLYIRVKVLGLEDKKGLFSISKAAEKKAEEKKAANRKAEDNKTSGKTAEKAEELKETEKAEETKSKAAEKTATNKEKDSTDKKTADNKTENKAWDGWNTQNIASVKKISGQDWFEDFGLSISSISLSVPLTNQEIDEYMNRLPADTSVTRRNIIHFALSSVGRVPYYWGGKPAASGYEGNNFGALIPADPKGRLLRGLDCSGWINWVYWSATGKRLAGESTSSLCLCGKQVSLSELKPGDIIVRTGANAHVVMFLGWTADGQMNVIHETSGSINNVMVATIGAPPWPYYRKLVE